MSTIYTDAAGNKYIGDCRWGNHDINYPTTEYLKSVDTRIQQTTFLGDVSSILSDAGWGNISVGNSLTPNSGVVIFSATPPGEPSTNKFRLIGASSSITNPTLDITSDTTSDFYSISFGNDYSDLGGSSFNFDYSVCVGSQSVSFVPFLYDSDYSGLDWKQSSIYDYARFFYWGKLLDINTNFNYYSNNFINQSIIIRGLWRQPGLRLGTLAPTHYIDGTRKIALQTDRARYTISCSDGQTPGAQWATDMWVYDNNATLGYPVIGRVPNMLLGIGTYTYLKPVKIEGSVFPDGGSPWYLPVGTFSGKVLLMRCYSSM